MPSLPSVESDATLLNAAREAAVNYARRLVGPAECEDIAQEVIVRLLPILRSDPAKFTRGLVLSTTHNAAMNMLCGGWRSKRRDQRAEELAAVVAAPEPMLRLADAAQELPDGAYEALMLVEIKGMSEKQAALALNVSRSLVGAKRRRAIDVLRTATSELPPPTCDHTDGVIGIFRASIPA